MRTTIRMWGVGLGLAALVATAARADDDDSKKKGPASLVGVYYIESGERDGNPEPPERVQGSMVRFSEDRVVVTDKQSKELYGAEYRLNTAKEPWEITMTSKLADQEGRVARGLIEKKGDQIRLVYSLPGGAPPTDFQTSDKQLMFVMKKKGD
ncbi:MAG: TIGR03067 domain-containing protein [Isosphaeraceae bacterium]